MKAVVFHDHGDSSVLSYESIPDPVPTAGEVLVRVRACAINGLDIYAREGGLEEEIALPHVSGADVSGEVAALGANGIASVSVGDRVVVNPRTYCGKCRFCLAGEQTACLEYSVMGWHRPGGYAELVTVPASHVTELPAGLSFSEGAAVPMAFTTAWRMLFHRAKLSPDETVLILGASGGVASAAVQLATAAGARVLAVTSPEKVDRVAAIGPHAVLTYEELSSPERVMELTESRGVDVLFQTQGGPTWKTGLDLMGRFGRIVVCSAVQGAEPPEDLGTIWWKQLSILGSTGGTPRDFHHVMAFLASGQIRPLVSDTFPLQAAAEAQDAFSHHDHVGKVVLEV